MNYFSRNKRSRCSFSSFFSAANQLSANTSMLQIASPPKKNVVNLTPSLIFWQSPTWDFSQEKIMRNSTIKPKQIIGETVSQITASFFALWHFASCSAYHAACSGVSGSIFVFGSSIMSPFLKTFPGYKSFDDELFFGKQPFFPFLVDFFQFSFSYKPFNTEDNRAN